FVAFILAERRLYLQARTDGGTFAIRDYALFRVDCLYSRDHSFKAYLLFISTVVLITVGGAMWYVSTDSSVGESLWSAWTFVADPGTHADSSEFPQRIVGVLVTIGGMVIFALVIGIISEDVSSLMDGLRKGTCAVIAHNHTLILGYSDKLIPTIYQIALANESLGGAAIVVLSEVDKEELELRIRRSGIDLHGSEVIVRTGIPYLQTDLKRVSAEDARSIVILSDRSESNADMADVNAVRNVLCLNSMGAPRNGHIVCEICDIDNEDLVRIVGKNTVETFVSHDIIGRLMIQCARERGLSLVLENLLGFDGDEFYISEWPELVGMTFEQIMFHMEGAVVVGFARCKLPTEVTRCILLNPPLDAVLEEGDAVVVIAEDDDTYRPAPAPLFVPDGVAAGNAMTRWGRSGSPHKHSRPERFLFIGWRRDVRDMIRELDKLVSSSSQLMIFCNLTEEERQKRFTEGGFDESALSNITITHLCGNSTCRKDLEALPLESYDSILILADEEYENVDGGSSREVYADSRTLSCLLLVRDIQNRRRKAERYRRMSIVTTLNNIGFKDVRNPENKKQCAVISEILDARTRPLVSIASTTDYVTSNELLSMAIAMVAEQREVYSILSEIFSAEGNEIYLRPVHWFIKEDLEVSFFEVSYIAKLKGQLAFGYKLHTGEMFINPRDKNKVMKWQDGDVLLLLALN
ncbi:unnamed protein product, partial [Ectocarpus fasciculatus]